MPGESSEHVLAACAQPECIERVHQLLDKLFADVGDMREEDRIGFETAVAEIAANVVEHAGGPQVALSFRVRVLPDRLEALFVDTGAAPTVDMTDLPVPSPLAENGRGLSLARWMVDEVVYERLDEQNVWRIVRRRRR